MLLLAVTGEIDLLTVTGLAELIHGAVMQKPSHLVLDVSGVTFLSSSGIQALLSARGGVDGSGHELHLVVDPATRMVHRPLQITGVLDILNTHTSVADFLCWLDAN